MAAKTISESNLCACMKQCYLWYQYSNHSEGVLALQKLTDAIGHSIFCAERRWLNIYVCSCSATPSCPTLCNPMACSLPGSSVMGFSRQRPGVVCYFLLQVVFLIQRLSLSFLCLLPSQMGSSPLSHLGIPLTWMYM